MAQMYSDRVLVTLNGQNIVPPGDIMSFSLRRSGNAQFVQGMTTTGNASGATKGNNTTTLELTQAVQNDASKAPIDFSQIDYELTNVSITISPSSKSYGEHTYEGKQIILNNVFYMDTITTGGGQGQAITQGYTFGAIEVLEV
jgi:hypothetical protein